MRTEWDGLRNQAIALKSPMVGKMSEIEIYRQSDGNTWAQTAIRVVKCLDLWKDGRSLEGLAP